MTDFASSLPLPFTARRDGAPATKGGFDIAPRTRAIVLTFAVAMTAATLIALFRGLTGIAPTHGNARNIAVIVHVATVLPAIPLGGYLLLARKGTKGHKQLGKLWVALMVTTALSAIFIRWGGGLNFGFSVIHLFVPMTLWASYKLVRAARRGDMKTHKNEVLSLYLGALMIPGVVSMLWPGRLMNVWLFW